MRAGYTGPQMHRVFFGPQGLRAGWRFAAFLSLAFLIGGAGQLVMHFVRPQVSTDLAVLFDSSILAAGAMAATWILARADRKPASSYGLGPLHRARNLAMGMVTGFVALSVLMGILIAAGVFHPICAFWRWSLVGWGLYFVLLFLAVSLSEELLMRGYALFALSRGMGFWPAAVLLSVLFGAGHMGNKGEEVIGVANAMLVGMVFAYSVRWSGSLWWAIGVHWTWDWGESFFYGVSNSGSGIAPHHLFSGFYAGPAWLSGGSVGPEGSVFATLVILLMALVVRLTTPKVDNDELQRPPQPLGLEQPDAIDAGV